MSLNRSRWAALGAAVAVTLGAGGLAQVSADTAESVFVAVTPTRVLDTRSNVGLNGAFNGGTSRKLDVTGTIPIIRPDGTPGTQLVVPDGATAIVANLTAVAPAARGFVSIRPGTATGRPTTSNINIPAPGVNIPNAVTVEIPTTGPTAGRVDLFYSAPGATTHLLLDVVGYYLEGEGTPGPAGPAGPAGPPGPAGADGGSPERVVWVADDGTGDFTSLAAALSSINDATAANPYLIRIAPGVYQTTNEITTKDHIDIEGSGQGITTLRCTGSCPIALTIASQTEIRHLTVENTAPSNLNPSAIVAAGPDTISISNVTAEVVNDGAAPTAAVVVVDAADVRISDSTVTAPDLVGFPISTVNGSAIAVSNAQLDLERVSAIAEVGVLFPSLGPSSDVSILDSTISSVYSLSVTPSIRAVGSRIDGLFYTGSDGGWICLSVYNENFIEYPRLCGTAPIQP